MNFMGMIPLLSVYFSPPDLNSTPSDIILDSHKFNIVKIVA